MEQTEKCASDSLLMEWGLREAKRGKKNFTREMRERERERERETAANARNPITKWNENDDR